VVIFILESYLGAALRADPENAEGVNAAAEPTAVTNAAELVIKGETIKMIKATVTAMNLAQKEIRKKSRSKPDHKDGTKCLNVFLNSERNTDIALFQIDF